MPARQDHRPRGLRPRARRGAGLALLVVAGALIGWWALSERPATPAGIDPGGAPGVAAGGAPPGCAAEAPASAAPVRLPLASLGELVAQVGAVVCFTHDLVVTETFDLGRFGELLLADRRLYGTNTGLEVDDPALHVVRLAPEERPEGAWPLPWGLAPGDVRVGDAVLLPWGTLVASPRGGVALRPGADPAFEVRNPRPTAAPDPAGGLRVAAFNVGNLFVTLGARGARTADEAERQMRKLVAALVVLDADVVAINEVERGGEALAALRDALNEALAGAADGRHYRAAPEAAGVRPGDVIGQAFLYDPQRVELLAVAADGAGDHLRPPAAATFLPTDAGAEPFTVVAVHHRSRAGCPASGDVDRGFGCWNRARTRQSAALLRFAQRLAAAHGGDVLVVGDLNAHRFEPPLELFDQAGWTVLTDRVPPEAAYSYVFFGRSAALDHAIASASLATRVARVAYLPINADEPPLLAAIVPPGLPEAFAPDPYRSSDHDPVLVDLVIGPLEEAPAAPGP